jgi:hypothetical protein
MNAKFKLALAAVTGAAVGAAAVHGLHAQAKPKAYSVTEIEVIDDAAEAAGPPRCAHLDHVDPVRLRHGQSVGAV